MKKITAENIPMIRENLCAETDASGSVVIIMHNSGIFDRLAQRLLGKPPISHIHLDETGSFVWRCIDGSSISDIGERVKERFGSGAEPVYGRLLMFFETLRECGFVEIK